MNVRKILGPLLLLGLALAANPIYGKTAGVFLVGLGPGDPELATVKAIRLIQEADVIYTMSRDIGDRFAEYFKGKNIRELSDQSISRYQARKAKSASRDTSDTSLVDADKNRLSLVKEVRQAIKEGKQVVFVDSGDPLIYGPWVWMLQEFRDLNLEVVPGISSFNAGLAALKRDGTWASHTHSVILTTDRPQSEDSLEALAAHHCSMVIFTHRTKFTDIVRKLKTQYDPETPISIVLYAGYQAKQNVISGNLNTIESMAKLETLPFENIIFVGDFLTYDLNNQ
jgi:precorrin-4 methylase